MKTIAGCIIRDAQGRYLLVQERNAKVYGKWNIPAGWGDDSESPHDTATRETREEVGLTVEAASEPVFETQNTEKGRHYYAFLAMVTGGKLVIQEDETLTARWLTYTEIKKYNAADQIREPWIMNAITKVENENSRD